MLASGVTSFPGAPSDVVFGVEGASGARGLIEISFSRKHREGFFRAKPRREIHRLKFIE